MCEVQIRDYEGNLLSSSDVKAKIEELRNLILGCFFEDMETNTPPNSPIRKVIDYFQDNFVEPKLEEEWQNRAEEELNETSVRRKQELLALKILIAKDYNIDIPEEDDFLLRFLRARKFDSKKAFEMIQRYYLMKLKCPDLFRCPLPSESESVFELQAQYMLSSRDQFGRRVYIIRVDNFDSSRASIDEIFRTNVLALENMAREVETQIAGLVVVLDMSGLALNHAKFFTPYYAKKTVQLVQETFPLRFKGFHIINEPFYFDAIMAVLKPFLKDKMKKRVYLHGSDITSLHAFIGPEVLPVEYGGTAGSFDNKSWYLDLLAEEEYFKNIDRFGYHGVSETET
ncbi:alpha-tocopherol transfer protein-related [Holotrichia oblita]|uniref:Alpha-tocopherol transfer protein-related n=1 Tax=Holotrichia oblita TaxID=644536 RepID=A0ACB9TGV8_HOLOL|nr:alpha-tocopherol transfer protein-related [Holotrichia oblita]